MIFSTIKTNFYGRSELLKDETAVLSLLYAPLMEDFSLNLYMSMLSLNALKVNGNYDLLMKLTHLSLDELEICKDNLEKLQLIRTYFYEGKHQIMIQPPKSLQEFLKHDVLARLYLQKMGPELYHELIAYFQLKPIDRFGEEISSSYDSSIFKDYSSKQEQQLQEVLGNSFKSNFDQQLFLQIATETMFPSSLRTSENLKIIEELFNRYSPTLREMVNEVANCIDMNNNFDTEKLKRSMANSLIDVPSDVSDPFQWKAEQFLQQRQPDVPLIEADLMIIELLRTKYSFDDSVINVIIDYALKNGKGQLNKNYVEKIATTFKRNKVKNFIDAKDSLSFEKPVRTTKKAIKKVEYEIDSEEKADPKAIEEVLAKLKKGK